MSTAVETFEDVVTEDDFSIPCDVPGYWPERYPPQVDHDPAEWVGYKSCGCHRLLCESCYRDYLDLIAKGAYFNCASCPDKRQQFVRFERLARS